MTFPALIVPHQVPFINDTLFMATNIRFNHFKYSFSQHLSMLESNFAMDRIFMVSLWPKGVIHFYTFVHQIISTHLNRFSIVFSTQLPYRIATNILSVYLSSKKQITPCFRKIQNLDLKMVFSITHLFPSLFRLNAQSFRSSITLCRLLVFLFAYIEKRH